MNISVEEKTEDAKEYVDMLLTCQLAVEFNRDKPSKAVKHALKAVKSRVKSPKIKAVCSSGLRSFYKYGWLCNQLKGIGRVGGMTQEDFIRRGLDL